MSETTVSVRNVDDLRWWCRDCELPAPLYLAQSLTLAEKYARQHAEATGHRTVAHYLIETHYASTKAETREG